MIFAAGNVQVFSNTYEVPVIFNYVSGLEKDSPVHYGGHKAGKVKAITSFTQNAEPKILVTLALEKNVKLKKDTQVFIDIMGFMGEKFVELAPGSPESAELAPGESLAGTDPIPLMKVVKDGSELLAEFQNIADSLEKTVGDLNGLMDKNQPNIDEIFANLNASSKNLKDMTEDLKLHPWKLLRKSEGKKKKLLFF